MNIFVFVWHIGSVNGLFIGDSAMIWSCTVTDVNESTP